MTNAAESATFNHEDYISTVTVFGEVKKSIISKDFKGGKVQMLFGKTVLDFNNADIKGIAVLDISEAFGETIIIVPDNWRVQTDQVLALATFEDKRPAGSQNFDPNKVLIITGFSMFAAIKVVKFRY
jgi:predicted membrane protein